MTGEGGYVAETHGARFYGAGGLDIAAIRLHRFKTNYSQRYKFFLTNKNCKKNPLSQEISKAPTIALQLRQPVNRRLLVGGKPNKAALVTFVHEVLQRRACVCGKIAKNYKAAAVGRKFLQHLTCKPGFEVKKIVANQHLVGDDGKGVAARSVADNIKRRLHVG
jgi:hypothetical protein